jgi:hypothetical protein
MNTTKEIHFKYSIGILLFLMIELITLAFFDVPSLVDRLSFALTLSSLLLAVLAIFYTIISSTKQETQLTRLSETNIKIQDTSKEIGTAAEEIRAFARNAPKEFESIRNKVDDVQALYERPSSEDREDATPTNESDSTPLLTEYSFKKMFIGLQYEGMKVLYLYEVALEKSVPINKELIKKAGIHSFDYSIGILNGLGASGWLSFKVHNGEIIPVDCSDLIHNHIAALYDKVIRVLKSSKQQEHLVRFHDNLGSVFTEDA